MADDGFAVDSDERDGQLIITSQCIDDEVFGAARMRRIAKRGLGQLGDHSDIGPGFVADREVQCLLLFVLFCSERMPGEGYDARCSSSLSTHELYV